MTDTPTTDDTETTAISTAYKIQGKDELSSGAGVRGVNTAGDGTPIGVEGTVPNNASGYGLATPDDAKINGELDTTSYFQVNIDGSRNIYHNANNANGNGGSVVMGHSSNNTIVDLANGVFAEGATISGGGYDDGSTARPNIVLDNFGTVGGGRENQAGSDDGDPTTATHATIGGGLNNTASDYYSTVGGGINNTATDTGANVGGGYGNTASDYSSTVGGGGDNTASGNRSTVAGGGSNIASGDYSTVGGGSLNIASGADSTVPGGGLGAAESNDSFVWNDNSGYHAIPNGGTDGLSSDTAVNGEPVTGSNTFSVSAQGGVRFITGSSSVTYIDGGTTGWATTSSRAAKTNIESVDPQQVLDGVEDLEVATWEYKAEDGEGAGTTHIGPMAEEFHEIVDVGSSDEHINTLNADGVLFAAVQGLSEELAQKTDEISELKEEDERKDGRIADLEGEIDELEDEHDRLRDRLAAVEDHLGLNGTTDLAHADD